MKKIFIYTLLGFLYVTLSATQCEDYEQVNLAIKNMSSDTVYVINASSKYVNSNMSYSTLRYNLKYAYKMPPHSACKAFVTKPEYSYGKTEVMAYRFYTSKTLNDFSLEEIVENDIYDKQYVVTYDDLRALDFQLVYDEK